MAGVVDPRRKGIAHRRPSDPLVQLVRNLWRQDAAAIVKVRPDQRIVGSWPTRDGERQRGSLARSGFRRDVCEEHDSDDSDHLFRAERDQPEPGQIRRGSSAGVSSALRPSCARASSGRVIPGMRIVPQLR